MLSKYDKVRLVFTKLEGPVPVIFKMLARKPGA